MTVHARGGVDDVDDVHTSPPNLGFPRETHDANRFARGLSHAPWSEWRSTYEEGYNVH